MTSNQEMSELLSVCPEKKRYDGNCNRQTLFLRTYTILC